DDASQADEGEMILALARRQQIQQHQDRGRHREGERRRDRPQVDRGKDKSRSHRATMTGNTCAAEAVAFACTAAIRASTLASVNPVNEEGYTPIHTMRARIGSRIAHSRTDRSGSRRFTSFVTTPKITRWYIHSR